MAVLLHLGLKVMQLLLLGPQSEQKTEEFVFTFKLHVKLHKGVDMHLE